MRLLAALLLASALPAGAVPFGSASSVPAAGCAPAVAGPCSGNLGCGVFMLAPTIAGLERFVDFREKGAGARAARHAPRCARISSGTRQGTRWGSWYYGLHANADAGAPKGTRTESQRRTARNHPFVTGRRVGALGRAARHVRRVRGALRISDAPRSGTSRLAGSRPALTLVRAHRAGALLGDGQLRIFSGRRTADVTEVWFAAAGPPRTR